MTVIKRLKITSVFSYWFKIITARNGTVPQLMVLAVPRRHSTYPTQKKKENLLSRGIVKIKCVKHITFGGKITTEISPISPIPYFLKLEVEN